MGTFQERKKRALEAHEEYLKAKEECVKLKKEGLSLKEIAIKLGISESTCRWMAKEQHKNQDVT